MGYLDGARSMRIMSDLLHGCYRLEKRETLCRNDSIPETFQPRRAVRQSPARAGWFVGKLTLSHERGPPRPRLRLVTVRVSPADGEVHEALAPEGGELSSTGSGMRLRRQVSTPGAVACVRPAVLALAGLWRPPHPHLIIQHQGHSSLHPALQVVLREGSPFST